MRRLASLRLGCALAVALAACASPAPPAPSVAGPPPAAAGPAPSTAPAADGPRFSATGPDAATYGEAIGYPRGDGSTFFQIPFLVGSHSHLDEIFEGRRIARAATPSTLARVSAEPALDYEFRGVTYTLDDYLARNPATGLLVARGDTILIERYQYARTDRQRFTSWSMAKTVTAMLVGIALAEGKIRSVDDPAGAYVPALKDTEYGRTPLRDLLRMSSGVLFSENYSGNDDVTRLAMNTFIKLGPGGADAVVPFNQRGGPSGTRFYYASAETQVLGLVLRAAVGRPLADYLREKIWEPIGAEADATWLVDRAGQEAAFCCLNAVVRDYARLGLLLAHDGSWRGRPLIPAAWIEEATRVPADPALAHLRPGIATQFFGYGYQTWIFPGERRMFALLGVRGQAIFVDPGSRLVMVHTAVRKQARDPGGAEATALWRAIVRQLGG